MNGYPRSSVVGQLAVALCIAAVPCAHAAPDAAAILETNDAVGSPALRGNVLNVTGDGRASTRASTTADPGSMTMLPESDAWQPPAVADDTAAADRRVTDEIPMRPQSVFSRMEPAMYWFLVIAAMLVLAYFTGRQRIK